MNSNVVNNKHYNCKNIYKKYGEKVRTDLTLSMRFEVTQVWLLIFVLHFITFISIFFLMTIRENCFEYNKLYFFKTI